MSFPTVARGVKCYREFGWTGQTEARYVRLKARHNGRHGGWIFTDEIIVE